MFKLVLGAVFRNEADNMVEYIEHYLYHGIEHFYLINDGSIDNFREVLNPYIQNNIVTLFEGNEPRTANRQERVYNSMFLPHIHKSKWWLIADLDEFVYSPIEINLQRILEKYEDYSQVSAEWLMFGSDNKEIQPDLLVSGFLKRCDHGISYKTFVQSKYLCSFGIHKHNLVNNSPAEILLNLDKDGNADIIINHYRHQSLNRWLKRVSTRGDGSIYRSECANSFPIEVFYEHNYNDIYDTRLLDQNKQILRKILDIKNMYTY